MVHADEVPEQEGGYPAPFDRERLAWFRDLGRAAGSATLGLRLLRLTPGRRASFTHAHRAEEELVHVLAGSCRMRLVGAGRAAEEVPVRAGDTVAFPAGTGLAHTFLGSGEEGCLILCAGERREDDRCRYPDDPAYDAHLAATAPESWWEGASEVAAAGGRAVALEGIPEVVGHYPAPFDAEPLSAGKDLGRAAGSERLGAWRERIPPGRRTSFTHAHSAEEELVYVVEGECVARVLCPGQPPAEVALVAGHAAAFPAGTGIAHTFANRGARDCVVICFGERRPEDRVFYPEDRAYDAHLAATRPERWWSR